MSDLGEAHPPQPRGRARRRGWRHPTRAGRGFHGSLGAAIAWLNHAIATEVRIRRSIRELAAMPERGLHDLGLDRGDIRCVTHPGRF